MGRLLSNRAAIPRTQRPGFLAGGRSEGAKGTEHSQEERRNGGFSLPYVSQLGAICVPARQTSAFGRCAAGVRIAHRLWMLVDSPLNALTGQIIGAAIQVHRTLGPGLLESTYMPCLQFELATSGLRFVTQRPDPILYKGIELDGNYRIDLLVENLVVVEIKAIEQLMPVHQAEVLTYVRLLGCPGGLL